MTMLVSAWVTFLELFFIGKQKFYFVLHAYQRCQFCFPHSVNNFSIYTSEHLNLKQLANNVHITSIYDFQYEASMVYVFCHIQ